MDKDVRSLTVSIQHLLCQPRRRPSSEVPGSMALDRMSWRVTRPNHVNFRFLVAARTLLRAYEKAEFTPHPVAGQMNKSKPENKGMIIMHV